MEWSYEDPRITFPDTRGTDIVIIRNKYGAIDSIISTIETHNGYSISYHNEKDMIGPGDVWDPRWKWIMLP
ncbi:hypothetical protein UFOVP1290_287 [uncultured Caudovirales phage]|uniref:Uncharacterized protein n=1 Tax=uncultured Caudovirales phage TaxID=2100421 RepID=A0A6J5RR47_9CAUD|nr:hypothetical protein UFOVP1290_287 [uncultured Caudovirales phage]